MSNLAKTNITEDGLFHSESNSGHYWYTDDTRDKRHRYDGPAVVRRAESSMYGPKNEWWWFGTRVSEEDHAKLAQSYFGSQESMPELDFTF